MSPRDPCAYWLSLLVLFLGGCGAERTDVAPKEEVAPKEDWGVRRWADAVESLREGHNWSQHYVSTEVTCGLCAKEFLAAGLDTYSTRSPDLDFKPNGLSADPNLFALWMCPNCGYCAFAEDFADPKDPEPIRLAVSGSPVYGSYFDVPYSVLLRAAEKCYRARPYAAWDWAWLYLYGAWVARESERPAEEREYHGEARRRFEALAGTATGEKRAQAAYLVGEINRRYGRLDAARTWLDRAEQIAKDTKSDAVPSWIEACRKKMESDRTPKDTGTTAPAVPR